MSSCGATSSSRPGQARPGIHTTDKRNAAPQSAQLNPVSQVNPCQAATLSVAGRLIFLSSLFSDLRERETAPPPCSPADPRTSSHDDDFERSRHFRHGWLSKRIQRREPAHTAACVRAHSSLALAGAHSGSFRRCNRMHSRRLHLPGCGAHAGLPSGTAATAILGLGNRHPGCPHDGCVCLSAGAGAADFGVSVPHAMF